MTTLLWAVFAASLLGSLHCVGMCGGIVALCAGGASPTERAPRLMAAYHAGRLATYAALGAVSGAIGNAIDLGGGAVGLPRLAAVLAGALMIAVGLVALFRTLGLATRCLSLPPSLQRLLQRGMSAAMSQPPTRRSALIGLLTGFLPCGWLYAFVAASATTGDALRGAAVMTAFWLGTVPALIAVGFGVRLVARPLQRHLPALSALCMLTVGVIAVVGRLSVPTYTDTVDARFASFETNSAAGTGSTNAAVVGAAAETPACCADHPVAGAPVAPVAPVAAIIEAATEPAACCAPAETPVAAIIEAATRTPACCAGTEDPAATPAPGPAPGPTPESGADPR
jgi:sulfite exporter TauE/SafE